jgi:hypothetical protein
MFSFDLHDGFYAQGISPAHRDYFTVNVHEQLYRLAGLPVESLSPFYFCHMTLTFVNFLRAPDPELPLATQGDCTKTYLRGWRHDSTLSRRLSTIRRYIGGGAHLARTPRQPPRPSRPASPPNQCLIGTILSMGTAAWESTSTPRQTTSTLRSPNLYAPEPKHVDRATSKIAHRTSYKERRLATRQGPSIPNRTSTIPFFGYPIC